MTSVTSREVCLEAIQADSVWRKKEIATLKRRLLASDESDRDPLLRSAVVMIYAHWEGFVKTACELYLGHVNEMIRRKSVRLSKHFEDLLMWKMFRKKGEHLFLKNPAPFLEMCGDWPCVPDELLPTDIIDTESNLTSKVLKRLTTTVGLDYSLFQTKEKPIDESIVKKRNKIAHGERVAVGSEEYDAIEKEIRNLIDIFQEIIETCVQNEAYWSTSTRNTSMLRGKLIEGGVLC
jgi:RiboL-PSP-HEPN